MKKLFLLFLIFMVVGLAGCIPKEQVTLSPTTVPSATSAEKSVPTVVLSVPNEAAFLPDPGCTVITTKPTPGPTPESIYPPVTETDHVKGPADAKVTIIEYSDFQ